MTNAAAKGVGLLRQWLEKLGISDYSELQPAEKATYDQWETLLTKELQLKDLRNFLAKSMAPLAKDLRTAVETGNDRTALKIAARLENYEAILAFIDEPDRSRDTLIAHINNLLTSN